MANATTNGALTAPAASTNGSTATRPPPLPTSDPPLTSRSRRGPKRSGLALAGVLAVVLGALGCVWLVTSQSDRTAVVTLIEPVARGETVTLQDLGEVQIAADSPVDVVPARLAGELVGRVALADLTPGTLVSATMLAADAGVAPGRGVVGLSLPVGAVPSLALAPGNRVNVIERPVGAATENDQPGRLVVADAEVVDVATASAGGANTFVALEMSTRDAATVAGMNDRVWLVQVATTTDAPVERRDREADGASFDDAVDAAGGDGVDRGQSAPEEGRP